MLISDYLSSNIIICILFLIWPILERYGRNTEIFSFFFWFKWRHSSHFEINWPLAGLRNKNLCQWVNRIHNVFVTWKNKITNLPILFSWIWLEFKVLQDVILVKIKYYQNGIFLYILVKIENFTSGNTFVVFFQCHE